MKCNIGDLFVRERHRNVVFYISGIHQSGQYELQYIGKDQDFQHKHRYYEEEFLIEWVRNGLYIYFPVKE